MTDSTGETGSDGIPPENPDAAAHPSESPEQPAASASATPTREPTSTGWAAPAAPHGADAANAEPASSPTPAAYPPPAAYAPSSADQHPAPEAAYPPPAAYPRPGGYAGQPPAGQQYPQQYPAQAPADQQNQQQYGAQPQVADLQQAPAPAYGVVPPHGVPPQGLPPLLPPTGDGQPKKKRTGLIAGIVSGGVLLILIIAGVVGFIIIGASHTPQKAVEAYLGALVHGDAADALKLGGVTPTSADVLLTEKAYRGATDHISRYRLSGSAVSGDGAAVTAQITQGSHTYQQSFALVKAGKDLLFFDTWQLKPVSLGRATVEVAAPSAASFTMAGVPLKDPTGTVSLRALPATYPVKQAGTNEYYSVDASSASVVGFGDAASTPARVSAKLTSAGLDAANAAVNTYIDGCAASTEFRPTGCSFGATGEDSAYTYTNQKWTIDPRPVFTVGSWIAGGWAVSTTTPGSATFSATIANGSGSGTASAGPINVRVTGFISKVDASGATFDPLTLDVPST